MVKGKVMMVLRHVLTMVVALLVGMTAPLQAVAEGQAAGIYLADVYVGVGKTAEEAAGACAAAGYTALRGKDGQVVDLNGGTGGPFVALGYKTTSDAGDAVTDLAVMGMGGGYSFSSYADMMEQHRDAQIRPFVGRFMTTVAEYRANVASAEPNCRARAAFSRELLNHVREDDTGGLMGDLLLQPTLAEAGLTEPDGVHLDLERMLTQGNSQVIYLVEQVLAMAADTNPDTWIDRLAAGGPGLAQAQVASLSPTDAARELDARYHDAAALLGSTWSAMRDEVLAYGAAEGDAIFAEEARSAGSDQPVVGGEPVDVGEATVPTDVGELAESADVSEIEEVTDVEEVAETADIVEAAKGTETADVAHVTADSTSAIDLDAVTQLDATAPEAVEVTADNVDEVIGNVANSCMDTMAAMTEVADATISARASVLYWRARMTPYGDGTLYDLVTADPAALEADGYRALYPVVASLSAGQVAALEFLPSPVLMEVGCCAGEGFESVGPERSNLLDAMAKGECVSVYAGVDRQIFSRDCALTSDALRSDAATSEWDDALSFTVYTKLSWLATAACVAGTVYTFLAKRTTTLVNDAYSGLTAMQPKLESVKRTLEEIAKDAGYVAGSNQSLMLRLHYEAYDGKAFVSYNLRDPDNIKRLIYREKQIEHVFDKVGPHQERYATYEQACDEVNNKLKEVNAKIDETPASITTTSTRWPIGRFVMAGITVIVAGISLWQTISEYNAYYDREYTKIPRHLVDAADVTATDGSGNVVYMRNDRAYYEAAKTNAQRKSGAKKSLEALGDLNDLNGDDGKAWLTLYASRSAAHEPILAASLACTTGAADTSLQGVHHFGTASAANLTDLRYCYNDDRGGTYLQFQREQLSAPATASALGSSGALLAGGIGLAAGAALGAGVATAVGKRRRDAAA